MNKKQFLLLSVVVSTTLSHTALEASAAMRLRTLTTVAVNASQTAAKPSVSKTSKLRNVATNLCILSGLAAGGYASAIGIIGTNNKDLPVLRNESKLPEDARMDHAERRAHPYLHAFHEVNGMIVEDARKIRSKVNEVYTYLVAAAHEAFKSEEGAINPSAPSEPSENTKNNN